MKKVWRILCVFIWCYASYSKAQNFSNAGDTSSKKKIHCEPLAPTIIYKNDSLAEYSLHIKKPSETDAFHIEEGQKIVVKGYFHDAKILIESTHNGEAGYILIKPFSYVRKSNPSMGWPAWNAFDAILVNLGWVPKNCAENSFTNAVKPMFDQPIEIKGVVRKLNKNHKTSSIVSEMILEEYYDVFFLWELVLHQIRNSEMPPCGINYLPICIDYIK